MILEPQQLHWECPRCDAWMTGPTNRMHFCPGLKGLAVQFVPAGTKAKIEVNGREDYVGSDIPARDGDGEVVMSAVTTRDDGSDCVVYAPTATARVDS